MTNTPSLEIAWAKIAQNVAQGKVGKIVAFEIVQGSKGYELTCELPSLNDRIQGRSITLHPTAKDAAKAADDSLSHWLRRLYSNA